MRHRPGGPDRIGPGCFNRQSTPGEIVDDLFGQCRFAAEQMGQTGDVQQQTVWGGGVFHGDRGTEPLAPLGQGLQRLAIGRRIGRFFRLRPRDSKPLARPVGQPDAQDAFHRRFRPPHYGRSAYRGNEAE